MDVIVDDALAARQDPRLEPVCVILTPAVRERAAEVAEWLGADGSAVRQLQQTQYRRPFVNVQGMQISVVAFAVDEHGEPAEVQLHSGAGGLLVLCPAWMRDPVTDAVHRIDASSEHALVVVLLTLGHQSEDVVERLAEAAQSLDQSQAGLRSGPERREISRLRSRLFSLQHLWIAQRAVFEGSGSAAGQIHALLGDTLSRHSATISERLTLTTVTFLPLTFITGFFGMNFGWMVDRIGTAAAFVVFGIVIPVVLVVIILVAVRRLAAD